MKDLYGKKEKHDHKFSNILKGCILAIVMLAPFFAILSKIIYVSANKNAKDSYYGETINEQETKQVQNKQELTFDKEYTYIGTEFETSYPVLSQTLQIYLTSMKYNGIEYENIQITYYKTNQNRIFAYIKRVGEQNNLFSDVVNANLTFTATYITIINQDVDITPILNQFYYTEYNNYSYLDNVFYYAINQSKDEELLNWTKNTPIYNVINSMNTGLGLSANHILTYLLTYWSIILAIYIVFDIIIFVFTKITHYLQ